MGDDNNEDNFSSGGEGKVWNEEEERGRWKEEYDSLKSELQSINSDEDMLGKMESLQAAQHPPDIDERRSEPRYRFDHDKDVNIYAHIGPQAFPILNISVGGLAFHSDTYFEPGTNVLMSALGMVALDVIVVDCELEETDASFMEFKYLVRAKFSPRVNGYLVYVLSREIFAKQIQNKE